MGVFNKIKIELVVLFLITLNVFLSFNIDLGLYVFFQEFKKNPNNIYLNEFFVKITELGSSAWYFGISVFCLIFLYINKRLNFISLKKTNKLIRFFVSSFVYILTIGIVTQIFKHLIGRPRPNYTNFDEGVGFNFFTFESSYHLPIGAFINYIYGLFNTMRNIA